MFAIITLIAFAIVVGIISAIPKMSKIFKTMKDADAAQRVVEVAMIKARGFRNLTVIVSLFWVSRFANFAARDIALVVVERRYSAKKEAPGFSFAAA